MENPVEAFLNQVNEIGWTKVEAGDLLIQQAEPQNTLFCRFSAYCKNTVFVQILKKNNRDEKLWH